MKAKRMKTKGAPKARTRIDWDEAVSGVPTQDFFEGRSLDDMADVEELVRDLVHDLEGGYFATWEAVVRDEQGLPLTKRERKLLGRLLCFDEDDEDILYIGEIARPTEPWYEILRKIAPSLLRLPLDTAESYYEVVTSGWPDTVAALEDHGAGLSLPEGVGTPVEVVPEEQRHGLWIQSCCESLMGIGGTLGQETLSFGHAAERGRVDSFVKLLGKHEASVRVLGLTTEKLLGTFVRLPEGEGDLLAKLLAEKLKLGAPGELLVTR